MVRRTTYREKLKDPRWQRKRLEVLNRDKWSCRWCREKNETLHVHHLRYRGEPWEAADEDLITLCESCHTDEYDRPAWLHDLEFSLRRYPPIVVRSLERSLDQLSVEDIESFTNYLTTVGGSDSLMIELLESWEAETDIAMHGIAGGQPAKAAPK
jgi:hypothetical protein